MDPRHRNWVRAYVFVFAVSSVLVSFGRGESESLERLGVSTGVFSEEQAEQGAEAFEHHCAGCHGSALEGGFGPRLVPLDPFVYDGALLSKPFAYMRTEMPFDAPGSLEDDVYLAILTFILRANGYPSGDEPLSAEDDALARYVLDDPPAE